ncbi:hypothetical protein B0O99DRAFT_280149 [Bisporella sp. PMI_857]|nr:hypothetical protein B0O99DRAFT_280149 [Bisporella sp. PMI_857]
MYYTRLSKGDSLFLALISTSFCLQTTLAFTQCYYPDGSIPTDYLYEPCTGAEFSTCCIPSEGDICQENGLCWYPLVNATFRGTCTDRTWNDPACSADVCVSGYEDTWTWVAECNENGVDSYVCGGTADGEHQTANCTGNSVPKTISYRTTTTSSSATRYVSPSPIDTSLYSLFTETYTNTLTATVQTTTKTTTWESTKTSTLLQASAIASSTDAFGSIVFSSPTRTSSAVPKNNKVTLSTGVLIGVIAGPLLVVVAICVGIFFCLRKRSQRKMKAGVKIPDYPPPNGPVGADQVHPYEVDVNEVTHPPPPNSHPKQYYAYVPPVQEVASPDMTRDEKAPGWAVEMGAYEYRGPVSPISPASRSPAPAYVPIHHAVELDSTPSMRGR